MRLELSLMAIPFLVLAACSSPRSSTDGDGGPVDSGPCALSVCEGQCVDVQTHADYCGDCATSCGVAQACAAGTCVDETPATQAELTVDVVASNLEVVWEIRFLTATELLITERPGRVTHVDMQNGNTTTLGTLPVRNSGEGGLMGLALDPNFAQNQYIYVCYTYDGGGAFNRVSRLTYSAAQVSNEVTLLEGIPGAGNHNGCRVGFGPDGKLYATTGDAGVANNAQDINSLSGKVLRLNSDGSIPSDNPTGNSYVYTLGHRNAQGLDWNPATDVAFVSEHGPATDDEVNLLIAGANYGWPLFMGAPGEPGYEDAIAWWTPTIAPAGAVFYHDTAIRGWRGSYLLLTLKESDLRRLVPTTMAFTALASEEIFFNGDYGRLRAIRVGPDGWIYIGNSTRDGRGTPTGADDRILRVRMN